MCVGQEGTKSVLSQKWSQEAWAERNAELLPYDNSVTRSLCGYVSNENQG